MKEEFNRIREKLLRDPENGEAYCELGDWFFCYNVNQAYLCYEHASSRCDDIKIKEHINNRMAECRNDRRFSVHPFAFVILSFNAKDILRECLEAIDSTCNGDTYEVVVVDSASTDGVRDYLRAKERIKLLFNDKFPGFAEGCNQGAAAAEKDSDIFLLNNDAIITPHAVFWLRIGLYEDDKTGAVGPLSNNAVAFQKLAGNAQTKNEWLEVAKRVNLPQSDYARKAHWLQGHALLVRRKVWDELKGLDTRYQYGCGEDNDFGLAVNAAGYYTTVCNNAFVFHYGSVSMKNSSPEENRIKNENMAKLNEKWGIDWVRDAFTRFGILENAIKPISGPIRILEVNSGFGNIWNIFCHNNPGAEVYCIEKNPNIVNVAKNYLNIYLGDIEEMELPFPVDYFDYILIVNNTVQYLVKPVQTFRRLRPYLKPEGKLVVDSPNPTNIKTIIGMIKGGFEPSDESGILHHYTSNDLSGVLKRAGYFPEHWRFKFDSSYDKAEPEIKALVDEFEKIEGAQDKGTFFVGSYIIQAKKT